MRHLHTKTPASTWFPSSSCEKKGKARRCCDGSSEFGVISRTVLAFWHFWFLSPGHFVSPFASESCKWRQKNLDHFVVWFLISSFAGSPVHQSVPAIKPSFLRFFFSTLEFLKYFPSFLGVFGRVFLWSSLDFGGPLLPLWLCGCEIHFPLLDPFSRVIAGQDWCYFTCFQIKLPVLLAHLLALVLHGLPSLHHVYPAFRGASTSY